MSVPPDVSDPANEDLSLGTYLRVLRERKWWVIAVVLISLAVVTVWDRVLSDPTYKATSGLLRQSTSFDEALFNTQVFDLRDAERSLQTSADLISREPVAQMVKTALDSPRTEKRLAAMLDVEPQVDSDIINITASSTDPKEAAAVANAFAHQFITYRQSADRQTLSRAREQVDKQLAAMSAADRATERGGLLAQKAEELRILESMQTGGFEVVQEALVPTSASSPRPMRNAFLAIMGGLILGVLLAFLRDRSDRRIKTTERMEREYELPVLANIPRVRRRLIPESAPSGTPIARFSDHSSAFIESFRTLRSNLKYFEFDRRIRTIMVTSGLPEEGKTVTTVNLAISLALSGACVTVIEADLRRPMLHRYLHLSMDHGVSSVLAGTTPTGKATQVVRIDSRLRTPNGEANAPLARNFVCLASGPIPPNPAELLGSQNMRTLIQEAASVADYVLIDTPPVLVVADALSLVGLADAVIVCTRLNTTTIEEAREVRTLLSRTGAHTLGLVTTGEKIERHRQRDPYGYFESSRVVGLESDGMPEDVEEPKPRLKTV